MPQAADTRELRFHIGAGHRAEAVVRHAHRQQAGHAAGLRLGIRGRVQPAQPVRQLVTGRFHAELDRVVEPEALRLGDGSGDRVPQRLRVWERPEVGALGGDREQDVRGEQDLASRVRDGIGGWPDHGDRPSCAQVADVPLHVATDAHGLRKKGSPDDLRGVFTTGRSLQVGGRGTQPDGDLRVRGGGAVQLGRHPVKTGPIEGGEGCGRSRRRCGEDGEGSVVVGMGVACHSHEERRRHPCQRVDIDRKPR